MTAESQRMAFLGLGGGGGRIVAALARLGVHDAVAVADTDAACLDALAPVPAIALGQEWTQRDGCGGDSVLGERAASASTAALRRVMEGTQMLMVVAGLGGGTGAGAARVVARLAREAHVTTVFLVTLPFAFEGSWRRQEAEKALAALRDIADAVIAVPNDLLFTTLAADTSAAQAFELADTLLAESLQGLGRIASTRGLITADFASLRAILRQRRATCALGVGKGEGESGWQQAIDSFLACPLVGGRAVVQAANAAVVTLFGGPDLAVGDVQACLSALEQCFSPDTRLVVGAYAEAGNAGQVQITGLLCTYQDAGPTAPASKPPASDPALKPSRSGERPGKRGGVQGELPLEEQSLGIFGGVSGTSIGGQNLDVPTFQRKGIQIDAGD